MDGEVSICMMYDMLCPEGDGRKTYSADINKMSKFVLATWYSSDFNKWATIFINITLPTTTTTPTLPVVSTEHRIFVKAHDKQEQNT